MNDRDEFSGSLNENFIFLTLIRPLLARILEIQTLFVAHSQAAILLADLSESSSGTAAILKLFPEDPVHCGNQGDLGQGSSSDCLTFSQEVRIDKDSVGQQLCPETG